MPAPRAALEVSGWLPREERTTNERELSIKHRHIGPSGGGRGLFGRRSSAKFPRMLHALSVRKVSPSLLLLQFLMPTFCEVTEGAAFWSLGWNMVPKLGRTWRLQYFEGF